MSESLDCIVIGAGVVGLAVARRLAAGGREVAVLEAETAIGLHTSSRNSEVIHAGIYYPANSLKARLCVQGRDALYDYCAARRIPHRRTGKLIVAGQESELAGLERIAQAAKANGVDNLRWLDAGEVATLEPEVKAIGGLLSPSTGIVDSHELMTALQADLESAGGMVVRNSPFLRAAADPAGFAVEIGGDTAATVHCRILINAAGLAAPGVALSIDGLDPQSVPRAYYAKAHYFSYQGRSPFSRLVYPMPHDGGLGVHATLDLSGRTRFGPDVEWVDGVNYSFDERRKASFVESIRRYYPNLDADRLQPDYTGVRPKLSGPGEPAADFSIRGPGEHGVPGLVTLLGIESPGLTACLAIADEVDARLAAH